MKEKVTKKRYGLEFKKAAISKAKQSGNVSATARDLGLQTGLLYSWLRANLSAASKGKTLDEVKVEN